ncbi:prepilin peptidase [Nocardioides sp. YIM 152588]|uniref:prepilin peptidase n=1 Tax=Nocardioides sp. YIM 152588 TaxID=3158259 RepID=UPI0032E45E02
MSGTVPVALWVGLVGVAGTLIGSFLNVVVHRVPAGLSVVSPGSACPSCGHAVRGRDNVPVLSWLALRGRCRDCRTPIPVRYPLVEAGTGLLFVLVSLRLEATGELSALAACLVVAAAGVALALIDLEHGRLPFSITGVAAVLAVLALALGWWGGDGVEPVVVVASAAIWVAVYGGLRILTRGRGMGLGDVALAPLLGAVLGALGAGPALVGLAAGFILGALVGVALMATGRARRGTRIPYGPFMLAGAALAVFAGDQIASAYLTLVGLS